jgi:hypothetical protein
LWNARAGKRFLWQAFWFLTKNYTGNLPVHKKNFYLESLNQDHLMTIQERELG